MNKFTEMYAPPDYINSHGERILTEDNDQDIINFIRDNNEKAKIFLRSNRGWKSANECMAIFYGDNETKVPVGLSRVQVHKLRRQAREAVANATNIRPRWEHRSYGDKQPKKAQVYDDLKDDWWYFLGGETKLKEALQYAAGGGTGYLFLWPKYSPTTGRLEIVPTPLNWKQVLPFYAGLNSDVDSLYGLNIWVEMPVPDAHREFPNHIDIIKPDRNTPTFFANRLNTLKRVWKGVYDRIKTSQASSSLENPYPTCDIHYSWIRDTSINESGQSIIMGGNGCPYTYTVHSKWDKANKLNKYDIETKQVIESSDPRYVETNSNGTSKYPDIPAKCYKLFPWQRFIITTSYGVIYDGPPIYLNRWRPVVPFKFESVAGEFLGINLIRDGKSKEATVNRMLQAIEDKSVGRISPPIAIDPKLPKPIRLKLRTNVRLMLGKVFEYSPTMMEKALTALIPQEYFKIEAGEVDIIKYLQEQQDYEMGTNDSSFINKLNQMPAADTQEAYLNTLGSLAKDHSRGFELSLLQMARIWLDFVPQVYNLPRIIGKMKYGVVDLIVECKDYDPISIIPKPDEYCSYPEQWEQEMSNFSIYASPFSLQENLSQTNRLMVLTLNKVGVPISNKRLYDTFIPDGKFELEQKQWRAEQEEKIELTAKLQMRLKQVNAEMDPNNQFAKNITNAINSNGQNQSEGRPNTFQSPPHLEQKTNDDQSIRSTVATS